MSHDDDDNSLSNENKNGRRQRLSSTVVIKPHRLDITDYKILQLLVEGKENKDIAASLHIPLNTIQRRVKKLIEDGWITQIMRPNYDRLRYHRIYLHIEIGKGHDRALARVIKDRPGVIEISSQNGNSTDLVVTYVYSTGEELGNMIHFIRNIDGISKVRSQNECWSELINRLPIQPF